MGRASSAIEGCFHEVTELQVYMGILLHSFLFICSFVRSYKLQSFVYFLQDNVWFEIDFVVVIILAETEYICTIFLLLSIADKY